VLAVAGTARPRREEENSAETGGMFGLFCYITRVAENIPEISVLHNIVVIRAENFSRSTIFSDEDILTYLHES
jgi:hypothetical protein